MSGRAVRTTKRGAGTSSVSATTATPTTPAVSACVTRPTQRAKASSRRCKRETNLRVVSRDDGAGMTYVQQSAPENRKSVGVEWCNLNQRERIDGYGSEWRNDIRHMTRFRYNTASGSSLSYLMMKLLIRWMYHGFTYYKYVDMRFSNACSLCMICTNMGMKIEGRIWLMDQFPMAIKCNEYIVYRGSGRIKLKSCYESTTPAAVVVRIPFAWTYSLQHWHLSATFHVVHREHVLLPPISAHIDSRVWSPSPSPNIFGWPRKQATLYLHCINV